MHPKTIYSKTPKGVLAVKDKSAKLDRASGQVFLAVDGKSTVTDLLKKAGMEEKNLHETLEKLTADGFIRVFSSPEPPAPAAAPAAAKGAPAKAGAPAAAGADDDF